MRQLRFYVPFQLVDGECCTLPEGVFKHAIKVLRLSVNAEFILFCGDNREYQVRLTSIQKKSAEVKILGSQAVNRESSLKIHLIQSVSKGDRMDFVCQKATELGVYSITPVFTDRANVSLTGDRLEKKYNHWKGVTTSSCEQCGRNFLPHVYPPEQLESALKRFSALEIAKFVLSPMAPSQLLGSQKSHRELAVLVGPEGGLTENEIQAALAAGFQSTLLGPRVLRTETAAITFISLFQGLWGDLT